MPKTQRVRPRTPREPLNAHREISSERLARRSTQGCRNNWHIHHASGQVGQILLCTSGRGWYQAEGEAPRELHAGDVVVIEPGVKHWHGAARDSWFAHLSITVPQDGDRNEWLEPVSDAEYNQLP